MGTEQTTGSYLLGLQVNMFLSTVLTCNQINKEANTHWSIFSSSYVVTEIFISLIIYLLGQGLNFTSMFILVFMLRHSMTKVRQLGLVGLDILDRHIYFHKISGRLILVYSLLHTAMHLGNLCKILKINPLFYGIFNTINMIVNWFLERKTELGKTVFNV